MYRVEDVKPVDKETVLKIVTAQAQGIANEYTYQMENEPSSDWASVVVQGGAWALAVLYAEFTEDGIDPQDIMSVLKLEKTMTYGERRVLVESLFNDEVNNVVFKD